MKYLPLLLFLGLAACLKKTSSPADEATVPNEEITEEPPVETDEEEPLPSDDFSAYIGLTTEAAAEQAGEAGLSHRIIEIDGEPRPMTMDYRPDRLNFKIENGVVISVTNG